MDPHVRKKILDTRSGAGKAPDLDRVHHQLDRVRHQLARLKDLDPPPDYDRYIRSKAWKARRAEALAHYGDRCTLCGQTKDLQVHHLHYQTVGREKMKDLTVCCKSCHFKLHQPGAENPETWAGTRAHVPDPPSSKTGGTKPE